MKLNLYESVQRSIFYFGDCESDVSNAIKRILNKGDIFIDIGSNVGYYSLLASSLVGKTGKVYSIEACKETHTLLKNNITLNKLKNIKIENLAVSDSRKKMKMYHSRKYFDVRNPNMYGNNQGANSLFYFNTYIDKSRFKNEILGKKINVPEKDRLESYEIVQTDTFDNIVKRNNITNIKLIKVDIEGSEYMFLKGASKTLELQKPFVIMELHEPLLRNAGTSQKEIIRFMKTLGYAFERLTSTGTERITKLKRWEGSMLFYKK
jgi:FkbM family methyltransferase